MDEACGDGAPPSSVRLQVKMEHLAGRLHAHDVVFSERAEQLRMEREARGEAIKIASDALGERLEHSNGLLQMLEKANSEKARKDELDKVDERVRTLEQQAASLAGRMSAMASFVALALSVAALVAAIWKR